ncbi:hypothetical protein C5167_021178 [Papaver somniferum]|uniref:Alkyl transferase n=1 Tax=Papaver somniferum TaxID=3469 RepID=A0A4Y7IV67_PAPSO|nr:hypothetical protein C5167_021178 [Papaver somniferum]
MDNKVVNVEEELAKDMGKLVDGDARGWTEEELPVGLIRERIPRHVAVLTVFAFSTGNWVRPQVEIDFLMNTFEIFLRDLKVFIRNEVRVSIIGDTTKLPIGLQDAITKTSQATKNYAKLHVILAINYGGREDIIQACQSLCRKVNDNLIEPKDINENLIKQELETKCTEFPYPDLLIRTSGEHRLSNFLMWQLAYTELYFEECLWPDFGEKEFVKALLSFQGRQRRYGGQGLDEEVRRG